MYLFLTFTTFPKSKPKEKTYMSFKNFSEENVNHELRTNLRERCVKNYASLENIFVDALNRHAPLKKKVIRANHAPYVTKSLRKSSNLQKSYFLKKAPESLKKYKKKKDYCSRLYKKERKKFFSNLEICDNKTFLKTIQPFFSKKTKNYK